MQEQKTIDFEHYITKLKSIHKGFREEYKAEKITITSPCEYIYNILWKENLYFTDGVTSTNVISLIRELQNTLDGEISKILPSIKSKVINRICEKSIKIAINHIKKYANKSISHVRDICDISEFKSYKNDFKQNTPDKIIYESFGIEEPIQKLVIECKN